MVMYEAGERELRGDSRAAGLGRVLEHDHVEAVYSEMDRCHKAVVSASDDENPTHYLQPYPDAIAFTHRPTRHAAHRSR